MELQTFLDYLQKVKPNSAGEYKALCPAHNDKDPSLSIKLNKEKILLKCFAGCTTEAIVQSLGLTMADLFLTRPQQKPKIVKTYDYTDETGKLLFQVCRLEPKSFRQRHKVNGQWVYSMAGVRRVLYNLPQVINSPIVYFVEGEKDADNLVARGVVATTSPGGAHAWRDEYATPLYGKRVILIPDNDPPGHAYAGQVACSLRGKANVSCILLPSKDISDWLNEGHDIGELPNMERPITDLLWGILDQIRVENQDLKRRLTRIEQLLQKPDIVQRFIKQVGVKVN